jgi:hypothetical protein
MARTANAAFEEFHSWLTTSDQETAAAQSHRESLKACLTSNFGMTNFFRTGSFGNGTNIRNHSDTDYFAVIPSQNLNPNSGYTLRTVRDVLARRFPLTDIRVDSPAVVLNFGADASEKIEVIPAEYVAPATKDYGIYNIPNRVGGWMRSSPGVHNAYLAAQHTRLGNKVKPLVRFVKAWKYYNSVKVSSFYLEMFMAIYASAKVTITYNHDVPMFFHSLSNNQLSYIQDPSGFVGNIYACANEADRAIALNKLRVASDRATAALNAVSRGNEAEAIRCYGLLYDGNFPSYG